MGGPEEDLKATWSTLINFRVPRLGITSLQVRQDTTPRLATIAQAKWERWVHGLLAGLHPQARTQCMSWGRLREAR
jgi:hypothetical protein